MRTANSELRPLLEEAADLHADSMRAAEAGFDQLIEYRQDTAPPPAPDPDHVAAYQSERRRLLARSLGGVGAVAGGGLAAGLLAWLAGPAAAAGGEARAHSKAGTDVQAAQTAASIENLAIAVYGKAAGLPFMAKGQIPEPAGSTVTAFVTMTVKQHTDHAKAFNAAAVQLGGKEQNAVDQVVMDQVVTPALPTLKTPLDVVRFAADLEHVAAQTYAAETAAVDDPQLRKTFASIMGVEAQHRSVLLAVGALLENQLAAQIKLPPDLGALPAAAGGAGFPEAFLKLDGARPSDEGAVK